MAKPYQPAPLPLGITRELSQGSEGDDVYVLNCALMGLGYLTRQLKVPATFNADTSRAVRWLQGTNSLGVDGVVGPHTIAVIEHLLSRARGITPASGGVNARLIEYYSQRSNYDSVYHEVVDGWFGTTHNACVAFASTALRRVNVPVPNRPDASGFNPSTWTEAFYKWLQFSYGWQRFDDAGQLAPGDVVLTQGIDGDNEHPAHTYVFDRWVDSGQQVAQVIDNQAFTHPRSIHQGGGGFNFTPYQFHLRSPD